MMRASSFPPLSRFLLLAAALAALGLFFAHDTPPAQAQATVQPPTSLVATPGNGKLVVKWTAAASTIYFVGYTSSQTVDLQDVNGLVGTTHATHWKLLTGNAIAAATYTVPNLSNGTTYRVRVQAVTLNGNSAWVEASGTPMALAAPSDVDISRDRTSGGALRVTWGRVSGATGYEAEWRLASDASAVGSDTAIAATKGTSSDAFYITGLTTDTAYEFRVRAKDADGGGTWSGWHGGTPQTAVAVIWTGTLNTGAGPDNLGCHSGAPCATNLSPNTFTVGGTEFTVTQVLHSHLGTNSYSFVAEASPDVTTELAALQFCSGPLAIPMTTGRGIIDDDQLVNRASTSAVVDWQPNTQVTVRLGSDCAQAPQAEWPAVAPRLDGLALSAGDAPLTLIQGRIHPDQGGPGTTGFASDTQQYMAVVPYGTSEVTLTPEFTLNALGQASSARDQRYSGGRPVFTEAERVLTFVSSINPGGSYTLRLGPSEEGGEPLELWARYTEVIVRVYREFPYLPDTKFETTYTVLVVQGGPIPVSLSVEGLTGNVLLYGGTATLKATIPVPLPMDSTIPLTVGYAEAQKGDVLFRPNPRHPNAYYGLDRPVDILMRRGETEASIEIVSQPDPDRTSNELLIIELDSSGFPVAGSTRWGSKAVEVAPWTLTEGSSNSPTLSLGPDTNQRVDPVREIPAKYAELLRKVWEWRDDPCCVDDPAHTDRWDRVLLAFGITVEDASLTPMTADEAQTHADQGWTGWAETAEALREWEAGEPDSAEDAAAPTALTLALGEGADAAAELTVGEGDGAVAITATLDAPAPDGGLSFILLPGALDTAKADADYELPWSIAIAAGERSATATIAVTGDHLDEDDETLSISAWAARSGYQHLEGWAILTIADDDTAGVTVNAAHPFTVAEGGTAAYTVVLDSRPTADVTVTAASGDPGAATVSPASHVFTAEGWNRAAAFTVSGLAGAGGESLAVSHGVTSDDPRYGAVVGGSLALSVSDDAAAREKYADLIARVREWRNDPCCVDDPAHTGRWDRALLAFGETVADPSLSPMTAAEAQTYADRGWTRWSEVAAALRDIQGGAPVVEHAINDVTMRKERTAWQVSLDGVFSDPEGDGLTVTAGSSDNAVATVVTAPDYSRLMLTAKSRGTATVTVIASDGRGRTASDAFTVTVKAAPVVASPLGDVSLEAGGSRDISLTGVFSDADGDALTLGASSSNDAVVSAFVFQGTLTLLAPAEGTATVTVTARDPDGNRVSDEFDVSVAPRQQQPPPGTPNQAPTVSSAIGDVTIVNQSGTQQVSLSGVFDDADGDSLTLTAASSDEAVATVSVASDYSSLTVSAQAQGTATVTVTADDGNGGTVEDAFTVTVKAAPVVDSAISDITGLEVSDWRQVSLSGVFRDADGDSLTLTAASSDQAVAGMVLVAHESRLTVAGLSQGTATITVTARDSDGNAVSDSFDVSVVAQQQQQQQQDPPPNQAPTVASAIADLTIVSESGTSRVSLDGVFDDADGDSLTVTAASSDETKATVAVASDHSTLTVSAQARGTATITVTADDGNGGTVDDTFTVRVKAAPEVASPLADVSGLEMQTTREVSLAGVFSDADGDALTITAASSDDGRATVSVASDGATLTLTGVAEGTATVTVTAEDSDGNRASDAFQVEVVKRFASLIPQMYEWRNDPRYVDDKAHTDRWDRALLALGETVADPSLTAMTADEAQGYADRGWSRWEPVTAALRQLEDG